MNEQDLRDALHAARPSPSPGLEMKVENRLARLAAQPRTRVTRRRTLAVAAAFGLFLCAAAAVAAGLGLWKPPLKEMLNITEESRQVYEDSRLEEEHLRSVTRGGVTVCLEESVADADTIYLAFRVSGYHPGQDWYPYFAKVKTEIGRTEAFIGSSSGSFLTRETRTGDGECRIVYEDGNGDMMYVLRLAAQAGFAPLDGFPIHVTLSNLTRDDGGDVTITDVEEDWEFEWILQASEENRNLQGLELPLGNTGCKVRSASLTPLGIKVETEIPAEPGEIPDEDYTFRHPSLYGIRMKDGTAVSLQDVWSANHLYSNENGLYEESWSLNRVIRPEDAEGLVFRTEADGTEYTVPLPRTSGNE